MVFEETSFSRHVGLKIAIEATSIYLAFNFLYNIN